MKTPVSLLTFCLLTTLVHAHEHPGYSREATLAYRHPDWMALVDDRTPLSALSIPGTHDSMSRYGADFRRNQSLSLDRQLEAGVRAFDIRLRPIANRFAIHHGPFYLDAMFGDVLNTMTGFLKAHPSETLLVRVKPEYFPENCSLSFAQIFTDYHARYAGYVAIPDGDNPALGEIRGKIVFLQDFDSGTVRYGIRHDALAVQDRWFLPGPQALFRKWADVKAHLQRAASGDKVHVNYLSGAGLVLPWFVASGHATPETDAPRMPSGLTAPGLGQTQTDFPRGGCVAGVCQVLFEGTNVLVTEHIRQRDPDRVGIIMADFPGEGLIDAIIRRNLTRCRRWEADGRASRGEIYREEDPVRGVRHFRSLKSGRYGPFPASGSSAVWQALGPATACRPA